MDPTAVLGSVVDDSGHPCPVGDQQDSMEYLMNFMERLEEGLSEDSTAITQHLRVSQFKKGSGASESFLTEEDDEISKSTMIASQDTNSSND